MKMISVRIVVYFLMFFLREIKQLYFRIVNFLIEMRMNRFVVF